MATVREVIDSIPDEEMQGRLNKFFAENCGMSQFDKDVEEWYNEMGLEVDVLVRYLDPDDGKYYEVSKDAKLLPHVANSTDVSTIYMDSYGHYASGRRDLVCLYGIVSKIGHRPHWYELLLPQYDFLKKL